MSTITVGVHPKVYDRGVVNIEDVEYHLPVISEAEYLGFLKLMNTRDRPNEIPPTFLGWTEQLAARKVEYPKATLVAVTLDQFRAHCYGKSREPDLGAMGDLAVILAKKHR